MIDFRPFPKIPRLRRRRVLVTEKIDGTNACVWVDDTSTIVRAGSRNKWIDPKADNYGFAGWVEKNAAELLRLGPGFHYGEWWGAGIQRRYDLPEKRFSLFNTGRWSDGALRPTCCSVVPILAEGYGDAAVEGALETLRARGSLAAPGFMRPEGVIVYHSAARAFFKVLLGNDDEAKGDRG